MLQFTIVANLAQSRDYITLNQLNNINTVLQNGFDWQTRYGTQISEWLIENYY